MPAPISNGFPIQIPAVGEITDVTAIRVVLIQSGRLVSAPWPTLANTIVDVGTGTDRLLLVGDEQNTGFDDLLLEGDESGDLLLE